MTPTHPTNGRGTHEVRIGLWATEEQAREVVERLSRALCADPEHTGACEVPWSIALVAPEGFDDANYPELVEQARIEGTY